MSTAISPPVFSIFFGRASLHGARPKVTDSSDTHSLSCSRRWVDEAWAEFVWEVKTCIAGSR